MGIYFVSGMPLYKKDKDVYKKGRKLVSVSDKSEVPEQENGGETHYLREGVGPEWELGQLFTSKEKGEWL